MLIEYLKRELRRREESNPHYSVRAFAKSLELDSSTLSQILSGRRNIGKRTEEKILRQLRLTPENWADIVYESNQELKLKQERQLYEDELALISCWEHFAILSLLDIEGFRATERTIAERLGTSTTQVAKCLLRLKRLGLVEKGENDYLVATGYQLRTTNDIPSEALKEAHRNHIQLAKESLDSHSVADRDITGITMAVDSTKLEEAKRMIKTFRRRLADFVESGPKDRVFRLNVQFFPLEK